jgi:hypothetical protein
MCQEGADEDEEEMEAKEATQFRGLAARSNYLFSDRFDIQHASKEISRDMAKPKKGSWKKVERLGRYLLRYPRLIWQYEDAEVGGVEYIDVFSDSDWAGNKTERKSTSGGVAMIAGGVAKIWSSTQATMSLSVGEAEYYALVKAAAEGLGIQALAKDMAFDFQLGIWVDSATVKAIAARIGLGEVRHMEVKYLWVQQAMKAKQFEVKKVAGEENFAGIGTKPKRCSEMVELVGQMVARLIRRESSHLRTCFRRHEGRSPRRKRGMGGRRGQRRRTRAERGCRNSDAIIQP